MGAGADGFGMDHPVFVPDAGRDLSKGVGHFQRVTKLGAEDGGERLNGHEEVFAGGEPTARVREAAAGDDVMEVGMIEELAGPGVEHADHAQTTADEARVLSQLLESSGGSAKEQIVDQLLMAASQSAQLLWQSESHQEVMNGQEQVLLFC